MHKKKIRVGVLFGGKSAEHEISLLSAKNVIEAIDPAKYEAILIAIDKTGQWHLKDAAEYLLHANDPKQIQLHGVMHPIALIPKPERKDLVCYSGDQLKDSLALDVVFPVLHGTFGEDGTVQGLLKLAQIPFVGASVLGSAIGMDKDVMKRLLRDAKIPVARFITLHAHQKAKISFTEVEKELGLPFFVKPANAGSSVGISKVRSEGEFQAAIDEAFLYDRKILCEEFIKGREIECSVLGNENPIVSLPGEIVFSHEFYSYEAKYLDEAGVSLQVPAQLDPEVVKKMQQMARDAYQAICCEGMARVDFFVTEQGDVFVNELNTLPGFTQMSMYPQAWAASGLSSRELVGRLIDLALERFQTEKALSVSYVGEKKMEGVF